MRWHQRELRDPRIYQIVVLTSLLAYGNWGLGFALPPWHTPLIVATAVLTQWILTRVHRLPRFDPRSPFISALSLSLLLRTNDPWLAALAAFVTVASKFWIRVDGRHVFNPTNLGLVVMMILSDRAWVSPAQWGSGAFFGFLLACAGGVVVHRALRSDITVAFLAWYVAILAGRALWLGDPWQIPLHQLQSGALLLFAFFMISDPRTTPNSRAGRIAFAGIVALGAGFVHFVLYESNGFLWSLAALMPVVPLLNRIFPGTTFEWKRAHPARADEKGNCNETTDDALGLTGGHAVPAA